MKSTNYLMEHLNHTTQLIGVKDKHITLTKVVKQEAHIDVIATLAYVPPKCNRYKSKQITYDFQKPAKIPFIEIGYFLNFIRLKRRRFQCQSCIKSLSE